MSKKILDMFHHYNFPVPGVGRGRPRGTGPPSHVQGPPMPPGPATRPTAGPPKQETQSGP